MSSKLEHSAPNPEERPLPPGAPVPDASLRKRTRKRTAAFVAIFVVTVVMLLAGYRYSINTLPNDWYLFQVARHTTWLLDLIGYRARLEETFVQPRPQEIRAKMQAWAEGKDTPTPQMLDAAPAHPLTHWELYQYRLSLARRGETERAIGPRVSFVLTPGILVRLQEVQQEIRTLEAQENTPPERITEKKNELVALTQERDRLLNDPEQRRMLTGRTFVFIVIPECGAIEVMVIFLAAVIGFPTAWRKRALGLLLGLPILYLVNILRLTCLAIIGAAVNNVELFDFAHNYVWQAIYIIFVVGVWLAWVEYLVKRKPA